MAITLCGVVVMEGIIMLHGIMVSGWAVVGPGGRGWLRIYWQREWQGYVVIGPQKMKLAGKRKKESHTSRVSWHKEHSNIVHAVTRAQQSSEVSCAAGKECGEVVCNCEAQGDVGACQCRHVLSSPHVIAVEASLQLVVGHGMPLRERVGDWVGKEKVSKEERKRKQTRKRVNQRTVQRKGMQQN